MSRLALGTVQFGLDYGINNTKGQVPTAEVEQILDLALANGIDTLDTAAAYGESESILGQFLRPRPTFKVISKLPAEPGVSLRAEVEGSLRRLDLPYLDGYLMHSFRTWQGDPTRMNQMVACKEAGLVRRIGVSLYYPAEAEQLMDSAVPLDLVQVPYNVLDRRFEKVFERLVDYGTEIHVRSTFLQGLFFMNPERMHPRFDSVADRIQKLQAIALNSGIGVAALCMGQAAANPHISRIVIGVDSKDDLSANIKAISKSDRAVELLAELGDLSSVDENILLPFNWSKK